MNEEPRDDVEVRVTDKRARLDEAVEPEIVDADAAPGTAEPVDELERARAEAASHLDDLRRLKAEFENYRKRIAKEQGALLERASASVVERILPVLDNFELALMAADRTKDYEAMVRGVEMVYGELLEVLKKEGLERIHALHQPFDPTLHEAVMGDGDGDDVVVVEEMRPGYTVGGRVVRPTMVKVGPKDG